MPYRREIKGIKLLQERSREIESAQDGIKTELDAVKEMIAALDGAADILASDEVQEEKNRILAAEKSTGAVPLAETSLQHIYAEAEFHYPERLGIADILTGEDMVRFDERMASSIRDFDRRYGLDSWDYAIAGGCGLFAAMLDILCVKAPPNPGKTAWTEQVDGIFNRAVQDAFNKLLPPDLSDRLSKRFPIGAPDTSVVTHLIGAPAKALNPTNHRLRSLAHDPLLGLIFGVWDMMHGTCTTVVDGHILSIPSTKGPTEGSVFQLLGRMLGHLVSDVNAPSVNGNRGMGLPAPFMGLLRMFEGIPVGDSTFGRQIEWMFVNGYDFRQFVTTAVPMTIMEVLLRAFFVAKQVKLYGAPFGETVMDTMPGRLNPRFRMMLAMAYGTCSAVNAGKVYVTYSTACARGDVAKAKLAILDANYAAWMGFVWNSFHALKWALLDRQLKLWKEIETKEIEALEALVSRLPEMVVRAEQLPIRT